MAPASFRPSHRHDTLTPVPGKGTTKRTVRMGALWDDLGKRAAAAGTDRATVLRELIRWYLRLPDAELPERPPTPEE